MYDMIFKGICVAIILIMVVYYAKRKNTIRSAFVGMLSGVAALVLLHYFGDRIGYSPPVNMFNTGVALTLGIPGTALIMAVNIISLP